MASEGDSRKLSDLRVIDLKAELEKRGLDKTGVKATLIERLQKALREEGYDPDDYQFESTDKKPTKRPSISTRPEDSSEGDNIENPAEQSIQESETDPEPMETEPPAKLEMSELRVVAVRIDEVNPNENKNASVSESSKTEEVEDPKSKVIQEKPEVEVKQIPQKGENENKLTEKINTEEKDVAPKKDSSKSENVHVQDPESPINLTIEEDEENMVLHDDTEVTEVIDVDKQDDKSGSNNDTTTTPAHSEKEDKAAESQENAQKTPSSLDGKTTSNDPSTKTNGQAEKDSKEKNSGANTGRNLWVTNITQNTRATELKQVLSEFGKVIGAKVVTNARYPGARCYGYVTMETAADANNCIENLNNTELNGQIICVEKVKPDQPAAILFRDKKSDSKEKQRTKPQKPGQSKPTQKDSKPDKIAEKLDDKEKEDGKKIERKDDAASKEDDKLDKKKDSDKEGKDPVNEKRLSKENDRTSRNSREKDRAVREKRSNSGSRKDARLTKEIGRRKGEILTFDKIREERERQKFRERERILREEERRRREEGDRQREIEHRQRQEYIRLEREREKLRAEREKIEREKMELMRLERERQKQERERLEQEKLELQRAKMRLEEANRRPPTKRPANYRREAPYEDRKRLATDRHFEEAPPPPRFDTPTVKSSRDETPPMKKPYLGTKDYGGKSSGQRNPFDKRDSSSSSYMKHDREFESGGGEARAHQAPLVRGFGGVPSAKYDSNTMMMNRERSDIRDPRKGQVMPTPSPRLAKEARFSDRSSDRSPAHYRSVRDERDRRPVSDHKTADIRTSREHGRYEPPTKEPNRFERNSGNWHSGSANSKVFGGPGGSSDSRSNWNKTDSWRPAESTSNSDRWNGGGGSRVGMTSGSSNTMFGSNSGLGIGTSCPPPPGINNYSAERFDNKFDYKSSLSTMRKY